MPRLNFQISAKGYSRFVLRCRAKAMKDLCVNRTRNIHNRISSQTTRCIHVHYFLKTLQLFLLLLFPTPILRPHSHLLPPPCLLPLPHQHYASHHRSTYELHHSRACNSPHLNAHAPSRRPRERKDPFHISRHPTTRYPEHGPLCVPELQEEAEAVGAAPAKEDYGAIEGCLEGFEVVCCRSLVSAIAL